MATQKNYQQLLDSVRTDILIACRELEQAAATIDKLDVADLSTGVAAWRECLTMGLPHLEAKYGESSKEADIIRELLGNK